MDPADCISVTGSLGVAERDNGIKLDFANGHSTQVDILIGADGVRSQVRRFIAEEERAAYSGTSAFRGTVPVRDLPSLPDPRALQFWMGPDAHLLHYAIGPSGKDVNFFAVVEGPRSWTHENWTAPVAPDEAATPQLRRDNPGGTAADGPHRRIR